MTPDRQAFEQALEACASEPIHQIGHVQPHGALIAFGMDHPRRIVQASANIGRFLDRPLEQVLEQALDDIFPPAALSDIAQLCEALEEQPTASGHLQRQRDSGPLDLSLHAYRSGGLYVIEMAEDEVAHQEGRLADLLLQTQQAMLQSDSYFETRKYFNLVVELVRTLTGYDNVMVYRFDAHWNGEIIAQSKVAAAPSYLGMHFPASDIPVQARRLYTTNLVRVVADVGALPVPILPAINPLTAEALDLTYSALRSMSAIHIEYLRNIGVHASMVISLMQNGRLWGLIACHHLAPKPTSMGMREAAIFLGRLISTRLSAIEAIEQRRLTEQAHRITADLLRTLPMSPVQDILCHLMPDLQSLMGASGMIVVIDGEIFLHGETPDRPRIGMLLDWLAAQPRPEVVVCNFLGDACPALADVADCVAGIMSTPPTPDMRNCLIWLRKEKPLTINWAGKYDEGFVQNDAGNYRLTPRKSFELWSEAWNGRCAPWTPVETGVATLLALAIPESLAQKRQLEAAQALQRRTEAELRRHRDHLEELVRERTLALSIAKEAAESASRAKSVFLSNISHELRTPMNGIMGMTNLAIRRSSEPKVIEYLDKMQQSAQRLLAILNDLIDISAIESERLTLNRLPFNLLDLLTQTIERVRPEAEAKGLELSFDSVSELDVLSVQGDPDRLGQVLLNVLDNAIKFTPAGFVMVRCHAVEDEDGQYVALFEIQDTGIGIAEEAKGRIFTAFEQQNNASTRAYGGTGLGLAICKRLIKMMGGDIGVDSTEGSGSSFWFHVRLAPAHAGLAAGEA